MGMTSAKRHFRGYENRLGRSFQWAGFILLWMVAYGSLSAQNEMPQDSVPKEKVIVDHADQLEGERSAEREIQRLKGNVELRQGSIFMYCDQAVITENNVQAFGSVNIQQGDTTSVFSDSLAYIGDEQQAELFDSVILINGPQLLFTDYLRYDLFHKVASYTTGALLDNGRTQLTSRRGEYFVDLDEAYFKDSVTVVDSLFTLRSDTLKYNTRTQTTFFLGPTLITRENSRIYCEDGYYDIPNRKAEFRQNAQYLSEGRRASAEVILYDGEKSEITLSGDAFIEEEGRMAIADRIRYNELEDISYLEGNARFIQEGRLVTGDTIIYFGKTDSYTTRGQGFLQDSTQQLRAEALNYDAATGEGTAFGNVLWRDTVENTTIVCDSAVYNRNSDYLIATGGRPLFLTAIEGDTLYMSSDTLVSRMQPTDTTLQDSMRVLLAYPDVRVFKSNLQAVSDSLAYHSADSIFHFFGDPIIWSDTSEFIADTIDVQLANDKIDRIFLKENAMVITSPDAIYFNQVKGRNITALFRNNELYRTDVVGNAEAVYYILDERNAYVGPNRTACSEIALFFENNQVTDIRFYDQPSGSIDPMLISPKAGIKLEGFLWEEKRRPRSVRDLLLKVSKKRYR
jgi:lipopolysaccharide export system protein LptA